MGLVTKQKSELAKLLVNAQKRDGRPWQLIGALAGVNPKTIEGWTTGAVKEPRIQAYHRVAAVLNVDVAKIAEAIARDDEINPPEYLRDLRDLRRDLDRPEGSSETDSGDQPDQGDR